MNPLRTLVTLASLGAWCVATLPCQGVVTLLPVQDTTLYQDPNGGVANGSGSTLFIGRNGGGARRRALLRFDPVAAVPPGAVILRARLTLFVEQTSAAQPTTAFAHRVTAPWLEGSVVASGSGGGGGPAVAGETTWLHRDYPGTLWTSPGGDFDTQPSFTFSLPLAGATTSDASPGLIADVEDWIANPAANHGWLIKTDELQTSTARRCRAREAAASQPSLEILYMLPGSIGLYGQPCPVNGAFMNFSLGVGSGGGPVTGGATVSLFYVNGPSNSPGATVFSVGLDPIGVQLFPGCAAHLAAPLIPGAAFLTDASGFATASVPIPAGAPSLLLVAQAVALDASPIGFTLSNAGLALIQ
jgi:hypothetical protein